MKKFLMISVVIFSTTAFPNCELFNWRFHTEAVYKFPLEKSATIVQAFMRDGGILFQSDLSGLLKANSFLIQKGNTFGTINRKSLENAMLSTHNSVRGPLTFLKLKEELDWLPSEPIAIVNMKERSITTTGEKFLPNEKDEITSVETMSPNLSSALNQTLKKKNFKIIEDVMDYSKGRPVQVISRKLGEKNWKLVQVLTHFDFDKPKKLYLKRDDYKKEPVDAKGMQAWIAFLTMDDSTYWYIGNSSGDACGNSLSNETNQMNKEGIAEIGGKLTANYGYRFNGNGNELIYSLGDPNITYYLKFNELMLVIVNEVYR